MLHVALWYFHQATCLPEKLSEVKLSPEPWQNNNVLASFLLKPEKYKDFCDRLEKTSARWTVNTAIVLRYLAPSARGNLNWNWWNKGGRGLWVAEEVTRLDGLFVANLSDSKACGFPASLKTVYPPRGTGCCGTVIKLWNDGPHQSAPVSLQPHRSLTCEATAIWKPRPLCLGGCALAVRSLCLSLFRSLILCLLFDHCVEHTWIFLLSNPTF